MLKVGITGGIGSGKSMVCSLFSLMGIPVFNADDIGRQLLNDDESIHQGIFEIFGKTGFNDQNKPDRKKIGALVFSDPSLLKRLNALIHPAVFTAFDNWALSIDQTLPYCIKEAAIMYESGSYKQNDQNILVYSERETRIERVCKRDNVTRDQVESRMNQQMSEEEKMKLVDFVIYNDEHHSLIRQVSVIDNLFRTI